MVQGPLLDWRALAQARQPRRDLSSRGEASLSPLVLIQQGKERITVCCTQREQNRGRQEGFPLLRSWDRMGVTLHPASRPQHHSPAQGQIHSSAALGEQSTSSPGEELGLAETGQEDVSQALQPPPQALELPLHSPVSTPSP